MAAQVRGPSPSLGSASNSSAAAGSGTRNHHPPRSSSTSSGTSLQDFWLDDYAPLQWAGTQVLACLRDDEAAPNADLYRRISGASGNRNTSNSTSHGSTAATTSTSSSVAAGQPAYEPNLSTTGSGGILHSPSRLVVPQLRHLKSVALPEPLQDALRTASRHSFMGLLPGAHLAWLSVDDALWLWGVGGAISGGGSAFGGAGGMSGSTTDMEPPQPLCQFKVPCGQPIVAVGLVKPKPGESVPSFPSLDVVLLVGLSHASFVVVCLFPPNQFPFSLWHPLPTTRRLCDGGGVVRGGHHPQRGHLVRAPSSHWPTGGQRGGKPPQSTRQRRFR